MDGIQSLLKHSGVHCVDMDIANVGSQGELKEHSDLSSDHLWEIILNDIRTGQVKAMWFRTPCATFSRAREVRPGPPPLRDLDRPYGLPKFSLSLQQHEQVRLGTFYALKTAEAATLAHSQGIPFAIESPELWEGHISMFILPGFVALANLPGVQVVSFDQCMVGAETTKPTRVLYYKVPLSSLQKRRHHPKQWWEFKDWRGKSQRRWGAHPPLARRAREDGTPATAAAAVYPAELNCIIAKALLPDESASPLLEEPAVQSPSPTLVMPDVAQVVEPDLLA